MNTSLLLKSYRVKLNLTQEQTAEMLGVARQTYNSLENSPLTINLEQLLEIVSKLNGNIDEILDALRQDFVSRYQQKQ